MAAHPQPVIKRIKKDKDYAKNLQAAVKDGWELFRDDRNEGLFKKPFAEAYNLSDGAVEALFDPARYVVRNGEIVSGLKLPAAALAEMKGTGKDGKVTKDDALKALGKDR